MKCALECAARNRSWSDEINMSIMSWPSIARKATGKRLQFKLEPNTQCTNTARTKYVRRVVISGSNAGGGGKAQGRPGQGLEAGQGDRLRIWDLDKCAVASRLPFQSTLAVCCACCAPRRFLRFLRFACCAPSWRRIEHCTLALAADNVSPAVLPRTYRTATVICPTHRQAQCTATNPLSAASQ